MLSVYDARDQHQLVSYKHHNLISDTLGCKE